MEIVATLITDLPLDERRLGGVLHDCAQSSLAGAIQQKGLTVVHAFGDAATDERPREVRVACRGAGAVHPSAAHELRRVHFDAASALEFHCGSDRETVEDAWALVRLYAEQLRGWVMTTYLSYEEAVERLGTEEGLLHAPVGGRRRGALIAASSLAYLAP